MQGNAATLAVQTLCCLAPRKLGIHGLLCHGWPGPLVGCHAGIGRTEESVMTRIRENAAMSCDMTRHRSKSQVGPAGCLPYAKCTVHARELMAPCAFLAYGTWRTPSHMQHCRDLAFRQQPLTSSGQEDPVGLSPCKEMQRHISEHH